MPKNIGWGIIGASTIAREWMIDAIRAQEDSDVVALFNTDEKRGSEYSKRMGIPCFHTDLEKFLSEDGLDAVYISTTNEAHCPQTIAAAEAKRHVLCEKPLALTLEDAKSMVAACEKAGVCFGTDHHLRSSATHRAIRDAVQGGRIGQPIAVRVFHAIYLPEHLQNWRLKDPKAGGGAVLDLTVHDADSLRFILGEEPQDVVAQVHSAGMSEGGLEDGAMAVVRFPSGVLATLHDSFTVPHAGTGIEVHGTEGSVVGRDIMTQRAIGTVTLRTENGETQLELEHENMYRRVVRSFNDAILGKGQPEPTGLDGVHSLALALAVMESAATGKRVKVASVE